MQATRQQWRMRSDDGSGVNTDPEFRDVRWLRGHVDDILEFDCPVCIDHEHGGYIAQLSDLDGTVYDDSAKLTVSTARFVHNFSVGACSMARTGAGTLHATASTPTGSGTTASGPTPGTTSLSRPRELVLQTHARQPAPRRHRPLPRSQDRLPLSRGVLRRAARHRVNSPMTTSCLLGRVCHSGRSVV